MIQLKVNYKSEITGISLDETDINIILNGPDGEGIDNEIFSKEAIQGMITQLKSGKVPVKYKGHFIGRVDFEDMVSDK